MSTTACVLFSHYCIAADKLLAWVFFVAIYFLKSHIQTLERQSSASTQPILFISDALYCAYYSKCKFQIWSESVQWKLNCDASKFCHFIFNKKCSIWAKRELLFFLCTCCWEYRLAGTIACEFANVHIIWIITLIIICLKLKVKINEFKLYSIRMRKMAVMNLNAQDLVCVHLS